MDMEFRNDLHDSISVHPIIVPG